jgi:hypothetical protein
MYRSKCVGQVRDDFVSILEKCEEITLGNYLKEPKLRQLKGKILKLFSPMM